MTRQPPPEELAAYLPLTREEIVKLVLRLVIEEALQGQLAIFRSRAEEVQAMREVG